jgi:hypothetical protein
VNLREIDGAKDEWALEFKQGTNAVPTWDDLRPFLPYSTSTDYGPSQRCPQGGRYTPGRVGEAPSCSVPTHDIESGPFEIRAITEPGGSPVSGAIVEIVDTLGRQFRGVTDGAGQVTVNTRPWKPALIAVSKNEFVSVTNTLPEIEGSRNEIRLSKRVIH